MHLVHNPSVERNPDKNPVPNDTNRENANAQIIEDELVTSVAANVIETTVSNILKDNYNHPKNDIKIL